MYLEEEKYKKDIVDIRKKLDEIKISGYYGGMDKTHIYFEYYKNNTENKKNRSIVISHGFCENLVKYTEFIWYFYNKGYSVYGLEHRGMGRSTHLGIDESQVHVESFDHYIYDLKRFVDDVVKKEVGSDELYIFGHSLGGLITTRYIQMYPDDFKKVILSSPFYGVNLEIPTKLAKRVSGVIIKVGKSKDYTMIHKKYESFPEFEDIHTTSRARYEYMKEVFDNESQYRMAGASYKWFYECVVAGEDVFKKQNLKNIDNKDILLISCGNDTMVDIKHHKRMSNLLMKCKLYVLEDSKHEPYFECDRILKSCYRMMFDYLDL